MSRKIIGLILVFALCLSLAACSTTQSNATTNNATTNNATTAQQTASPTTTGDGKLFMEDSVQLSMLIPNSVSWPYQEEWYVKKTVEEETNVILDIILIEDGKYEEKFNLLVSTGDLPDIVNQYNSKQSNTYALQGAFIDVYDYIDMTPNFEEFISENQDHVNSFKASDGALYCYPGKGQGIGNRRNWFYRKDVFEANSITVPTTPEELYDCLKQLKVIYPDSYPLVTRFHGIELMSPSWKTMDRMYYDYDKEVFVYGPAQDEWKEYLMFMSKLVSEGLTPPDMFSINTQGWIDLLVQSKGFVTVDYVGRMDSVGASGKEITPEFEFGFMAPINGITNYTAVEFSNIVIPSKSSNIENAVKLIDWYYTDEAIELLSWGKVGKTYVEVEGKKQFLASDYLKNYGLTTLGWGLVHMEDAVMSTYGAESTKATLESPQYEMRNNPAEYMSYTEEESEIKATIGQNIYKYVNENKAAFILGQKSFDEWDAYVAEIENMGLADLIDMYTQAYERYK